MGFWDNLLSMAEEVPYAVGNAWSTAKDSASAAIEGGIDTWNEFYNNDVEPYLPAGGMLVDLLSNEAGREMGKLSDVAQVVSVLKGPEIKAFQEGLHNMPRQMSQDFSERGTGVREMLQPYLQSAGDSLMRMFDAAPSPEEVAKAEAAYNTNRARALDAVAKKYERQNAEMQARLDSLRSLSSEGTQVFVAGGKDSRGKEMEYDPRGYETERGPETPSKGTYSKTGEGFSAVSGAYAKKDLEKMGVEGQMADVLERIGRISPGAQLQVVQSLVGGRESPTQRISADLDKLSQAKNPRMGVEALKAKLKLRYPNLADEQLEEMLPILKMFKAPE